mmetsp:Transcript_69290/g.196415  ORF Transcript_69290/g.196415 Transcript_69290/m.196415 type:complete len:249 (-) Transcript_69290:771-1517(-)
MPAARHAPVPPSCSQPLEFLLLCMQRASLLWLVHGSPALVDGGGACTRCASAAARVVLALKLSSSRCAGGGAVTLGLTSEARGVPPRELTRDEASSPAPSSSMTCVLGPVGGPRCSCRALRTNSLHFSQSTALIARGRISESSLRKIVNSFSIFLILALSSRSLEISSLTSALCFSTICLMSCSTLFPNILKRSVSFCQMDLDSEDSLIGLPSSKISRLNSPWISVCNSFLSVAIFWFMSICIFWLMA